MQIIIADIIETTAPKEEPWVISLEALRKKSNFLNPEEIILSYDYYYCIYYFAVYTFFQIYIKILFYF